MGFGSTIPPGCFLDLPEPFCRRDRAAFCILPVPYEATTTGRPGTRFGPAAIIAASHQVELFDERLGRETYRVGIHTCAPVEPNASGPEAMVADVAARCRPLLDEGKFVVLLGGEHTVALGAVAAQRQVRGDRPFGVVQFDAHRDLRRDYQATRWSHACVAARLLDWGLKVVQVGVRAWSREEQEKAESSGVVGLPSWRLQQTDWLEQFERAVESLPEQVYLTFDLDVLDPSIMPAVGTPEPGGLAWYPTLRMVELLAERRRIIGLDLVELSPIEGLEAPNFLAARMLYRILGLISRTWPEIDERG